MNSEELPENIARRIERRWRQAYDNQTEADLKAFYDDWADTYDSDHDAIGCFHHVTAAELLAGHLPDRQAAIVDIGAGTGLVGQALHRLGYRNLTAVDFSEGILDRAMEKGVYRAASVLNLNEPLETVRDDRYAAAAAVGVFSYGQVQARALDELVRIVAPGGYIVLTLREDFFDEDAMGVRSRIEALAARDAWRLLEKTEPQQYLPKKEPGAMFRAHLYEVQGIFQP